jgi:prepilin-type N-terminal cleavage/methylation domain-containing protein
MVFEKIKSNSTAAVISGVLFLLLAIPTAIVGAYYYQSFDTNMTADVFSQRQALASLSATALQFKIEQLVNIADNFAANPLVASNVEKGAWVSAKNAIKDLLDNPANDNYYVDRLFLVNTSGTIEAAYPGISSSSIGVTDPSFHEWQNPILTGGQAWFMSDVFVGKNSGNDYVELAIPIRNAASQIVGVLGARIPTNNFSDFGKDIDVGSDGFAYFTDRFGNIVSHPKYASYGPLVSYASVPAVQAALAGQSGVGISYNPIEQVDRVTAYTAVPGIGWIVIAQQPSQEAFMTRDSVLRQITFIIGIICLIELLGAFLIFWLLTTKQSAKRPKTKSSARKGFTLIELLVVIAIIAILSIVVVLVINPAELLKQSRDASRVSDLSITKTAILLYLEDTSSANLASSSVGYVACYVSTISGTGTTTAKCGVFATAGATVNASVTKAAYRSLDSTGWIPINFSKMTAGSPFGQLPVDPVNNASDFYSYAANANLTFELDAIMESNKYGQTGSDNKVSNDGGDNSSTYEIGSNLFL